MIDLEGAVELERAVWDALVAGDAAADRAALADRFVGVYPSGFGDAAEHAAQLAEGATVASYELRDERLLHVAPEHVMLMYRANYVRPGRTDTESMYVSSLWSHEAGRWSNVFSQDTPVGTSDDVV